jgi:hypothetical protein
MIRRFWQILSITGLGLVPGANRVKDWNALALKLCALGYAAITAGWVFCWVPFGIGYFGLPWESRGFRVAIFAFAGLQLFVGLGLCVWSLMARRMRCLTILAVLMSALASCAMIDWIWVHPLHAAKLF